MDVAGLGMADDRFDQSAQRRFLGVAEHEVAGVRTEARRLQHPLAKGHDRAHLLGNGEHAARYGGCYRHSASSHCVQRLGARVDWSKPRRRPQLETGGDGYECKYQPIRYFSRPARSFTPNSLAHLGMAPRPEYSWPSGPRN